MVGHAVSGTIFPLCDGRRFTRDPFYGISVTVHIIDIDSLTSRKFSVDLHVMLLSIEEETSTLRYEKIRDWRLISLG